VALNEIWQREQQQSRRTTLLNLTQGLLLLNGQFNRLCLVLGIFLGVSLVPWDAAGASNEVGMVAEDSRPTNVNKACLVIIGASYAEGWKIDELIGCSVINKGIGGTQTFEFRERFDRDVIAEQPDFVLIWGFVNDIFRADPDKVDAALKGIRDNYEAMVTSAKSHGIEPILATEATIGEPPGWINWLKSMLGGIMGKTGHQEFINGHVMATNDWLREYASNQGLQLLDMEKVLANADGSRQARFVQDDGSHMTPVAYQVLSDYAREQLSR
jgi:lysophospholipase L1-like esterase